MTFLSLLRVRPFPLPNIDYDSDDDIITRDMFVRKGNDRFSLSSPRPKKVVRKFSPKPVLMKKWGSTAGKTTRTHPHPMSSSIGTGGLGPDPGVLERLLGLPQRRPYMSQTQNKAHTLN